jgi:glycosyltransferase involved in cell wall biosynthesis
MWGFDLVGSQPPQQTAAAGRPQVARDVWINGRWTAQRLTGTQRYASEILRALPADVLDRCVLTIPKDGIIPEWLNPRVHVVRSRWRGQIFDQLWLPLRSAGRQLVTLSGPGSVLKRRQIMVMHDAGPFANRDTYGRLFGLWYRLTFRWLSHYAEQAVTVSSFSRAELAKYTGTLPRRFVLAPCGADHIQRERPDAAVLAKLDHAPFVLFVGSQVRHKNFGVLFEQLTRLPINVAVAGDVPHNAAFRGIDVPATKNVRWLGRVSEAELASLYANAVCVVFPSLYEGFGLPVVEAQTMGCPVVHSNKGSLPEIAGAAGIEVSTEAPDGFLEAVQRIIEDAALRERLIQRGRVNASRFSWSTAARTVINCAARRS